MVANFYPGAGSTHQRSNKCASGPYGGALGQIFYYVLAYFKCRATQKKKSLIKC